ncbi:MAG: dihydroorotate dehydrogenase [Actinomycetota bacterium]
MGVDMSVELAGLRLRSPVLSASGCFGSGREMSDLVDPSKLGAVVCKTITLEPRSGIAPPRGAETPSGMLNAIGLQNPGVDAFIEGDLAWLAERNIPTIVSVGGHSIEEYVEVVRRLRGAPKIAIELNLSCPNLESRGYMFALDFARAPAVTGRCKEVCDVPILVKLSPDVTDLVAIAKEVSHAGADGLSLINTTLGMAIDTNTWEPKLSTGTGGLSGPAIRPIAVRCVYQVSQALPHVPICGIGGVSSGGDAAEMLLAGASCVQIGTANFYDPRATARIAHELEEYCEARGVTPADLKGRVK